MVDDVAVLLADACTRIPSDEDGGRVLEDHENEEDETEGRAGRVIAGLLCHGDGSTSWWGVLGRVGGHVWCIGMSCGCPLPTSYRLHGMAGRYDGAIEVWLFFDPVFCCGPAHQREARERERGRETEDFLPVA